MATYFPSLSNQRDGYQKFGPYSEMPVTSEIMMCINQEPFPGLYSEIFSEVSLTPSNCIESEGRNEMVFIPPIGDASLMQHFDTHSNTEGADPVDSITSKRQNIQCLQGLSLSLGTQTISSFLNTQLLPVSETLPNSSGVITPNGTNSNLYNLYKASGFANFVSNSKFIKAAQELLDEVVSIKEALNSLRSNKHKSFHISSKESDGGFNGGSLDTSLNPSESAGERSLKISPTERQDLKNKCTKLLSMLDEVDQRYKQYYHEMQLVASSFDMVAGYGTAELYIALAHKTISQHFRRLRDAISDQIQITKKSLGEEDTSSSCQRGIPRLRYVDQKLRQRRALQQFGLTKHTWRPQRGLPESSVSILRAWLFEHFLHPYPKDSEKITLAKQTGLTRNQVANWFINARVRLWKPMVEEMYKEEFSDPKLDFEIPLENTSEERIDNLGEDFQNNIISENNEKVHNSSNQVSLALELRNFESGGFSKSNSIHLVVDNPEDGSTKLDYSLDYPYMDPGSHHQFRLDSSSHLYAIL